MPRTVVRPDVPPRLIVAVRAHGVAHAALRVIGHRLRRTGRGRHARWRGSLRGDSMVRRRCDGRGRLCPWSVRPRTRVQARGSVWRPACRRNVHVSTCAIGAR